MSAHPPTDFDAVRPPPDAVSGARAGADGGKADVDPLWHVLAGLLALAAFLTPFVFRAHDDNRLTSWRWLFDDASLARFVPLIAAGIAIAYLLRGVAVPRRSAIAGLFTAACAVSAALWGEPEVLVDAARYFAQAKHMAVHGVAGFMSAWGAEIGAWTDLPLVPFLYGLIFRCAGEERVYIQCFTTLAFAGTVVLTYRIGSALWDDTLGMTAAVLLFGMPYLLTQVPLMLVDVPTMFFVALAAYATLAALRRGGPIRIALAAAAILLAFFAKYSAWLMLTVLPVLALAEARSRGRDVARRAVAIAGAALLLIAPVLLSMADVLAVQLALLREFQVPGLALWEESFVSTFFFQSHAFIALAAAASLWLAWRARDARYAAIAWLPLLLLALGIRRARYLLPAMPLVALMAAYGLRSLPSAALRKHVVLCVVGTSLVLVFAAYLPFLQRASAANLQSAGAYLDTLDGEAVEVVALPQTRARVNAQIAVPLLDLHTAKRLVVGGVDAPPPPDAAKLPLRFTWEHRAVSLYGAGVGAAAALPVAVISDGHGRELPPSLAQRLAQHDLARQFVASEGVFAYQTRVDVYRPRRIEGGLNED